MPCDTLIVQEQGLLVTLRIHAGATNGVNMVQDTRQEAFAIMLICLWWAYWTMCMLTQVLFLLATAAIAAKH